MSGPPLDLQGCRILLANDDGFDSAGLDVLRRIALEITEDVWICAPDREQSARSHALTIDRPLRLRERAERVFTVDGTPTDCVLIALNRLLADHPPDLVLSGVNHGYNIADDVSYSGTLAVAMEATLLGFPAIALSQEIAGDEPDWRLALDRGADLIRRCVSVPWRRGTFLSINFPDRAPEACTGVVATPHGERKVGDNLFERIDPRGRPYFWIGGLRPSEQADPASDVGVLQAGGIAVTALSLDWNEPETTSRLGEALK